MGLPAVLLEPPLEFQVALTMPRLLPATTLLSGLISRVVYLRERTKAAHSTIKYESMTNSSRCVWGASAA